MASARVRIGKVTYKASNLTVIDRPIRGADVAAALREGVRSTIDLNPQMAGFALVAWDFQALATTTVHIHRDSVIRSPFAPSFVAEVLRERNTIDTARKITAGEEV